MFLFEGSLLVFLICSTAGKTISSYNLAVINEDPSNSGVTEKSINNHNLITVPTNCPSGQELVNGACRDIWKKFAVTDRSVDNHNMVTVPANCPPGQQLINGACRDIWKVNAVTDRSIDNHNVVTVPANCPPGQQLINGACRDIWKVNAVTEKNSDIRNMITVPTNCPSGQVLINGACRDVWKSNAITNLELVAKVFEALEMQRHDRFLRQADEAMNINIEDNFMHNVINKNIINVPNQCPAGYKPDSLGYCRPILN